MAEIYKSDKVGATGNLLDSTGNATIDNYTGYQIGGVINNNDGAVASVSFQLPSNYSAYNDCVFRGVFYSYYASSSWYDNWSCVFRIKLNNVIQKEYTMEPSDFSTLSSGSRSRVFEFNLNAANAPTFKPGQIITFEFDGDPDALSSHLDDYSVYVTSGRCLYLCYGTFTSNAATLIQKKYLCFATYKQTSVSQNSAGIYYVKFSDYKKYWGLSFTAGNYVAVTLDGTGSNYYSDVTYYTPTTEYLTDDSGNRLYVVE